MMKLEILINEIKKQISDGREGCEVGGDILIVGPLEITEDPAPPKMIGPGNLACFFSMWQFSITGDCLTETYFRGCGGGRAILDKMKKERLNLLGYNNL